MDRIDRQTDADRPSPSPKTQQSGRQIRHVEVDGKKILVVATRLKCGIRMACFN